MSPTTKKQAANMAKKSKIIQMDQNDDTQSSDGLGDSMKSTRSNSSSTSASSTKQIARINRMVLDKNSEEYRKRRERNNLAVKKSRNKSKLKTEETMKRVRELKAENDKLETKVKLLSKELSFLKDLFLAHAGSVHGGLELQQQLSNGSHQENQTQSILSTNGPIDSKVISSALANLRKEKMLTLKSEEDD